MSEKRKNEKGEYVPTTKRHVRAGSWKLNQLLNTMDIPQVTVSFAHYIPDTDP